MLERLGKAVQRFREFYQSSIILRVMLLVNLVVGATSFILHSIIPIVLNYAPDVITGRNEQEWFHFSYTEQFILITLTGMFIISLTVGLYLRGVSGFSKFLEGDSEADIIRLNEIRKKCINIPYLIYFVILAVTVVCIPVILLAVVNAPVFTTVKITIIAFSSLSIASIIILVFAQQVFKKILLKTYRDHEIQGFRIGLKSKLFLLILPLIAASILFTSLVGYSVVISEKGDLLFKVYKSQLTNVFDDIAKINNLQQIYDRLGKMEDKEVTKFVITPVGEIKTSDNAGLSRMFLNYMDDLAPRHDGRVYEHSAEKQGVIIKLKDAASNGYWTIGVKYQVASNSAIRFFALCFLIMFFLSLYVLYCISKTFAKDVSTVAESLTQLSDDVHHIETSNMKLAATSNDEISDLVVAFNEIIELEKTNIIKIRKTQKQLTERERLASLGELAGGVAHDINSPLLGIQGSIYLIRELFNDYRKEDMPAEKLPEIVNEIEEQIKNSNDACTAIADIVNSVRNHTRNLSGDFVKDFYITDVLNDLKVMLNHHLKVSECELVIIEESNAPVSGDPGKMSQVLTNLIMNAMQSYEGNPGIITATVSAKADSVVISIEDEGAGIPEDYRDGIFKNMFTTKGKEGTGLGLFLSYSTITGHFGGEMWFESSKEKGTKFSIVVPASKNNFTE